MKLNSVKRLVLEDFPSEVRAWLGKLIQPLNDHLSQVSSILSKGITIRDNLKSQTYDLTITASQTYPIKLSYSLNEKPTSVTIGYLAEDSAAQDPPSAAYCVHWIFKDSQLQVTLIGLDSSKRYKTTIISQV